MSGPEVDEVLNYLSIKFNKIFCDRDFVCCVIEDFQTILDNKDRICVLVFPTLGPIYLKALRYQARIFDLAVFNITSASGKFKSIAVCHKDHLKKTSPVKEETMSETLCKRKRPERQLYVPPAQRASRLSAKHTDKKVISESTKHPQDCSKSSKIKESSQLSVQCLSEVENVVLTLCDVVNLIYFFNTLPCEFKKLSKSHYEHRNCEFKKFLNFKQHDNTLKYDYFIKIYDNFTLLSNTDWRLSDLKCSSQNSDKQFKSYPIYDLDNYEITVEKPSAILVNFKLNDFEESIFGLHELESNLYKIECDIVCDELEDSNVIDLSLLELGHFFILSIEGSDYFHECQEKHDVNVCCKNVRQQLEANIQLEKLKLCAINESDVENNETTNKKSDKKDSNGTPKSNKDIVKNKINTNKKKVFDDKHQQEKEIMRMTKEYINRRTRPLMKYVDDADDTLRIDKDDSVNNWEDLFDDNGEIQEELLTEIVDKVGDDITIVKASEDYTAYTNKPPEELEHVVELYNFPPTLETYDLVQAFSGINSDAMYIKWVDDTHALLVLGSLSQAQKAINMRNPLIKVRPMTAASAISMDVANKSDLKPAMKRPPTNLQTARRLITSHLGKKSKITKEQMAKEQQDLKNAKEMKRMLRQNEKDAWEGNLRSTVN